jgi:hypothetical protein
VQIPAIRAWREAANDLSRLICWASVLKSEVGDAQARVADVKPYFEWVAVDGSVPSL